MEETPQGSRYGKRPVWQWLILYIVLAAVIYGLIYYFVFSKMNGYTNTPVGNGYASPTVTTTVTTQPSTSSASPTSTTSTVDVTVSGREFAFTPSVITVKKGQPIQLTFKNEGQYPHNLTISDLNVKTKTIQSGQQDTITFTPSTTGSFTYLCTVPGHADRGMKGTLIVQ